MNKCVLAAAAARSASASAVRSGRASRKCQRTKDGRRSARWGADERAGAGGLTVVTGAPGVRVGLANARAWRWTMSTQVAARARVSWTWSLSRHSASLRNKITMRRICCGECERVLSSPRRRAACPLLMATATAPVGRAR